MNINEARLIREIKKRCTYRRLAEIYYEETDLEYGNQGYGEDLCKAALEILYPNESIWTTGDQDKTIEFKITNKSSIGNFYWWE